MVGLVLIDSISGCFWRNLDSILGSLNGVVIVDWVEASAEVVSFPGPVDDTLVLSFSSSTGGKGVVDLKLNNDSNYKMALNKRKEIITWRFTCGINFLIT